jgi:hypothetical protein
MVLMFFLLDGCLPYCYNQLENIIYETNRTPTPTQTSQD